MPLILSGSAGLSGNVGNVTKNMLPAGSVLQVVQAQKTDAFTTSSGAWVDIPNLLASITPLNAASKILVQITVQLSHVDSNTGHIKLLRDSTQIAMGDAIGSFSRTLFSCRISGGSGGGTDSYMINPYSHSWLDSPNTVSPVTYKLQALANNTTPFWINRSGFQLNTTDTNMGVTTSTITLMEIKA